KGGLMTNRKLLKSLVLIAVAALATGAIASRNGIPPKIQAKLAPSLLKALEANEISIPILVKMKKQADLSEFDDVRIPRKERISKVYDALRTVAMESQADLVDLLRTRGTTFQRFYIYNAIAVWSVNEVLLKEIAARDDVEKDRKSVV